MPSTDKPRYAGRLEQTPTDEVEALLSRLRKATQD